MGKFFEAMQRAAGANAEPAREAAENRNSVPELDDSLFDPEWPEGDSFQAPAPTHEVPDAEPKKIVDNPPAEIRTVESKLRAVSADDQKPTEDPASTSECLPPIQVAGSKSVRPPDLKTRPTEMMREPAATLVRVHPAYDRIVQKLKTYRKTPRQGVILIASAVAEEGASSVARGVATALSQAGIERVLLIDGNLRTPSQHTAFGIARDGGFSDVLKGETSLASVINDDVGLGISVITCGSRVKSPTQVVTSSAVEWVTASLLSLFDWIIIDGPPASVYPDVATIGTACGGAILVLQAESTRSEVAEEAKEIMEGTGAKLLGAVLNRRRYHIPPSIYKKL